MPEVDLEKLRSIGFVGKTSGKARVRSLSEGGGRATGFEVDYGDGRTEAVVRPETIRQTVSVSNPGVLAETTVTPATIAAKARVPRAGGRNG